MPAIQGSVLLLLIVKFPLQVATSWPLHTNEPVKQYKAVDIPDYSVDFATYLSMEPKVSLHTPGHLTITTSQQCTHPIPHERTPPMYPTSASSAVHRTSAPHQCTPAIVFSAV